MRVLCIAAVICSFFILAQSRHNPNGPVYDGLDSVIDEAAKHTQIFADDVAQRLNQTFYSIKEKVEEWKNNNAFTQKLECFQAENNQCIKENELVLAEFMRNLVKTYDMCSQEVKGFVSENLATMKDSLTFIQNAPRKIEDISEHCFSQNKTNLAVSSLCVVTRIAEIEHATSEANVSVEKFVNHAVDEIEAFAARTCKGVKDLEKEFVQLVNKIQACMQNKKE